jgi:hypothetical protein
MRIPRERSTLRRQMVIIACAALWFAMIAWLIAPLRNQMPPFPPPSTLKPRLDVSDPVIDIGTVPLMAKGRHTWIVKNTGQAPLRIWQEDQHDCGLAPCTLDEIQIENPNGVNSSTRDSHAKITISSGGRASIVMYWETRRTAGVANPWLDFGTDDPKAPRIRLALVGEILPSVRTSGKIERPSSGDPSFQDKDR